MFSKRVDHLSDSIIREILAACRKRPDMISFAGGLPALETLPSLNWDGVPPALGVYGPSEGEPFLREAVAALLTTAGLPCSAGQVMVLAGSQQGIDLSAKLFVDEGTRVLVESPTYSEALQVYRFYGARYVTAQLGPDGIDPDEFEAAVVKGKPAFAYLIPNFQNPAGTYYGIDIRQRIAAICDRYNLPVVEDDAYREPAFDDSERTPLCSFLQRAPWVYLGTFSKTILPGLRTGYLASSGDVFPMLMRLKHLTDLHSNRYSQFVLHRFITGPDYAPHLDRMRVVYRHKRDVMQATLHKHLSSMADWVVPRGGLFFWLRLRERLDLMAALKASMEAGVAFTPGQPFYADPAQGEEECCFRLNFSHVSEQQIEAGIPVIAETIARRV